MSINNHKFLSNNNHNKILIEILKQLEGCEEFIFSVAFITFSGVVCLIETLRKLEHKGIKGTILSGCYLNFTEPKALEKLAKFSNIKVKLTTTENFHAKGFFFRKDNNWQMIIGSTNLTQSALTINTEWNVLFKPNKNLQQQILTEFYSLYNQANHLEDVLDKYKEIYKTTQKIQNFKLQTTLLKPNKIQIEALDSLDELRKQGEQKALLISATGTGKTFVSAFDVAKIKPKRCLFVVHRVNIAAKAKDSFARLINDKTMGLVTGNTKQQAEYIFTTVQTISRDNILNEFSRKEFDYIIIDEVHHAEAKSYKKVLDYFESEFLLGMTATPERSDDADIFKLFDYNIAYEIRLHQALEQQILCPFHYFAIEDFYLDRDKQIVKDFNKLISNSRVQHIITKMNFYSYSGDKRVALMFVSNIEEALVLAEKLTENGINAKALTSKDSETVREKTIYELEHGQLEVIVSVDVFNEGIDIPKINQVILLRPTQSAIVYIQQLGRGLRKHKSKEFVVVLDFIANYENNFLVPVALSQNNSYDKDDLKEFLVSATSMLAGESTISFTEVAQQIIYQNINKTNFSQLKNIKRDYIQLKKELGKIPSLLDFEQNNFISPQVILSYKDTYYDVLKSLKEDTPTLTKEQSDILKFISKEFTPAKRLYETLILLELLYSQQQSLAFLKNIVAQQIGDFCEDSFENAIKHLALDIFKVNAGRQEYKPLICVENDEVSLNDYKEIISNEFLYQQIVDLLQFNKVFYTKKYAKNREKGLSLYAKYSKKDIAHILNQDYSNGGINLAGYRFFDNSALLYITLDESKKFSKYDNKFITNREFVFYSKPNKKLDKQQLNNETLLALDKLEVYVFVRINIKDEYFYFGKVKQCNQAKQVIELKNSIKYIFELENEVCENIWQYISNIQQQK